MLSSQTSGSTISAKRIPGHYPQPGNPVTIDSVGGINATKVGLTTYNGISGGGGPPVGIGIAPGSTMSMQFQNIDSRYQAPVAAGLVDNFGMEAYIQPQTTAEARPFYNGGDGTPLDALTNGFGLTISSGGQYEGLLGGVAAIPTGVPAVPGKAVEMALVSNAGVFTVYINDVAKGSLAAASIPVLATDLLSIGNFDATPAGFAGVVDQAHIFTFAPGAFNPSTDLGGAAVPEPSTLSLVGAGSMAIAAYAIARGMCGPRKPRMTGRSPMHAPRRAPRILPATDRSNEPGLPRSLCQSHLTAGLDAWLG